jgi:hypothetical protein
LGQPFQGAQRWCVPPAFQPGDYGLGHRDRSCQLVLGDAVGLVMVVSLRAIW